VQLRLKRAGDHYYSVAQCFTASFIKKGDICEEKIGRIAMRFRVRTPFAANPRMEYLFERAFFSRVAKYYGPKFLSIQVPSTRKDSVAKFQTNFLFNLRIKIDKPVRLLIRIEKPGNGNDIAQTLAKARLASGNSASDPDGRHANSD
jgi:hypothetical protein